MSQLKNCEVISLRKVDGSGNLKAFADIRIGGGLIVRDCTVMNGRNGLFASLPRRIDATGSWHPIVIASDDEIKDVYQTAIMESYESPN